AGDREGALFDVVGPHRADQRLDLRGCGDRAAGCGGGRRLRRRGRLGGGRRLGRRRRLGGGWGRRRGRRRRGRRGRGLRRLGGSGRFSRRRGGRGRGRGGGALGDAQLLAGVQRRVEVGIVGLEPGVDR